MTNCSPARGVERDATVSGALLSIGTSRKVMIYMGPDPTEEPPVNDPTEAPPVKPGRPVEPPREDPPGNPLPGPDVPPPMHEPESPVAARELPGRMPEESPQRGPATPAVPAPAFDLRT
jgi:hypothetical protein